MALYKVDDTTADLTKVAGGTLYAELPIGSWVKNDMNTLPSGFLKEGDTISQSECPELYAKYGSTVPYKADTSELSEYEKLNFPASLQVTAQYDGVIITTAYDGGYLTFNINDNKVYIRTQSSGINAGTATVPFRKGDVISIEGAGENYTINVRYYKKSLIVKAKHTPVPADFMDAVEEAIDTSDIAKMLPYSFNTTSNIGAFNRQFVYQGHALTWSATHTGRLTLRLLKHGDGYSLYLGNQNGMLDTYDNFFGSDSQGTGVSDASITLSAYVKKGDVIRLESNLPSTTAWADTFFCQTGLLAYNDNYD